MSIRSGSLAACAISALLLIQPAGAQAWLGQMVGEMAAQQAAAQREEACRKGAPASPRDVKSANKSADKLMESYFALTSKSSKHDIEKLFATDSKTVSWKDDDGKVALAELGTRLDEASATHAKVLTVVGGDDQTMRGIWSSGEGTDIVYYGVDITIGEWWESPRILHMTVSKTLPETPPAYCHLDPEQTF